MATIRPAPLESAQDLDWRGTDRYEVVRYLGRGGMGAVYEARDRESRQPLALKTLLHATPAMLYLFKQEFRTLADVDHPNLVRLHELVMTGADRVFFTMELVIGTDFVAYVHPPALRGGSDRPTARVPEASGTRVAEDPMSPVPREVPDGAQTVTSAGLGRVGARSGAKRGSPADFERLRSALRQLVEGVMALHAARKLHRDIKPSNVLVTTEGRVVILDFGVATELSRVVDEEMREEDQAVGTAAYMAPEQAFDEPTTACDWYAVGAMLYEAIVGRPPFSGPMLDVLTMKSSIDPLAPSDCVEGVPADLDALCRALLQREPAMRPAGPEILRRLGVDVARAQPISSAVIAVADAALPSGLAGRAPHQRALHDAFEATLSERTVTVRVGGRAGMGKSALVNRFLDELVGRGSAVVLRGRAYEREAVPYKAVDGVVDSLSRYLMCLTDEDLTVSLPRDTWALTRLFPVLRRVPGIAALAEEPVTDPQRVRLRAFHALRELFASLSRRRPLVLFIDDAQWGDTDSAALLLELTRPPFAPPLMLAMTYRSEDELTSPFLAELAARWPPGAESRSLEVGPLDPDEARTLALSLVGSTTDDAQATADAIAREAGGSPFLIEELARNVASEPRVLAQQPAAVSRGTLEQMLGDRVERLPEEARRLLQIIAVSGRPVPKLVATDASGIGRALEEVISTLRSRRFVRTGLRDGREVLEVIHDRIRETIVGHMSAADVREHHARLASALEAAGDTDVEALATHLFGAGQKDRAAKFAERAAEQAVAKLAFDQAAHLLRLTIGALPPASPDAARLRKRLGEVLEWAGRCSEAGRVYLEAAEGAAGLDKLDLQRAAAEQLFAAGLMDEGARVLHGVLAPMGERVPRTALTAMIALVAYRFWFWLTGLRFRAREVRPEDRLRVAALYTCALGFSLVDQVRAAAMKARTLRAALRAGDRAHAARAAALVVNDIEADRASNSRMVRALNALAQRLAEEEPDKTVKFTVKNLVGITHFLRARFREAKEVLDPIQATLTLRRSTQQAALQFTLSSIHFMGDMKELTERYKRVIAEAQERGNRFVSVAVRTSTSAPVWLSADDPDRARHELEDAISQWAQANFSSPRWRATVYLGEVDLYVGDAERAHQRVEGLTRALKKSQFTLVQYVRVLTAYVQGRAAAASLFALPEGKRRKRRVAAEGYARVLERERVPWSDALAAMVRAALALEAGDRDGAEAALHAAAGGAEAAGMAVHAAAARHELGLLLGGDRGASIAREAVEAMASRGIQNPARYAAMLVPGLRTRA